MDELDKYNTDFDAIMEHRRQWLAALFNGEYKQGRGALQKHYDNAAGSDEFCCLGVYACKFHQSHMKYIPETPDYASAMMMLVDPVNLQEQSHYLLTTTLLDELGMTGEFQQSLAIMNDNGYSFKQIASMLSYIRGSWGDSAVKDVLRYCILHRPEGKTADEAALYSE